MLVALEETKAGNLREDIFVTRTLGDLKEKQKSSRIVESITVNIILWHRICQIDGQYLEAVSRSTYWI